MERILGQESNQQDRSVLCFQRQENKIDIPADPIPHSGRFLVSWIDAHRWCDAIDTKPGTGVCGGALHMAASQMSSSELCQ